MCSKKWLIYFNYSTSLRSVSVKAAEVLMWQTLDSETREANDTPVAKLWRCAEFLPPEQSVPHMSEGFISSAGWETVNDPASGLSSLCLFLNHLSCGTHCWPSEVDEVKSSHRKYELSRPVIHPLKQRWRALQEMLCGASNKRKFWY